MLKYSKTPGIFKLEGNRLGRPYHRLPTLFTGNFDVIDSHLGSYFLKKHRSNITLKKIGCEMDIIKEGANKRGNSSRLTQSFHFFMFEPIFSPVNALNQPI